MHRLFIPSWGPSDWRRLLANPSTQWVRRKSAFELAVAWESAGHPAAMEQCLEAVRPGGTKACEGTPARPVLFGTPKVPVLV